MKNHGDICIASPENEDVVEDFDNGWTKKKFQMIELMSNKNKNSEAMSEAGSVNISPIK